MSFQALNSALSGLRIAQQQLSVISNNVANVGTPGYTRKILPQSTQVLNSTGQIIGVQPETIIRNVDLNLSRDLWTQVSAVSALDVKGTYLGAIEKFHGPPDKELSVAAEIARLRDAFSALADAPDDGFLLQATLDQAEDVASKFNDFSNLINQQRNDAQGEMSVSVERANDLLEQIAEMNVQIKGAGNLGRSTAAMEDQRDEAIKQLANEIEISLFKRGDGVIVIQTRTGVQLADETAQELFFSPGQLGPDTFYPSGAAGVYVGGNPATNLSAFDITNTGVGGRLGGLIELRDDIMPQYQAQIDEMAHKLALRFEAQGLRLFTDDSGLVPADTPPNPTLGTPVPYVGFAGSIQVNPDVVANINLIQQGTYTSDETIPTGSNVVIRRVLEHTFGTVDYQEAVGTTDLNVALPATDLQQWLGIFSQNTVTVWMTPTPRRRRTSRVRCRIISPTGRQMTSFRSRSRNRGQV
jgi:flagellar hook-associated protein 1 FlgK